MTWARAGRLALAIRSAAAPKLLRRSAFTGSSFCVGGGGAYRRPSDAPRLPAPAAEEPAACDGVGREGDRDGEEDAARAEAEGVGEGPRERDLEDPEDEEIEEGRRPGVAGAVERLTEDHAV